MEVRRACKVVVAHKEVSYQKIDGTMVRTISAYISGFGMVRVRQFGNSVNTVVKAGQNRTEFVFVKGTYVLRRRPYRSTGNLSRDRCAFSATLAGLDVKIVSDLNLTANGHAAKK